MIDGKGMYGFYLHYGFLFGLVSSHLLVLIVLWRKKKLNMDEQPKYLLFEENENE